MLDFPNTPTVGQQYTLGDKTWQWNGVAWDAINPYAKKSELAAGTGSSLVTFTQSGAGSVPLTLQAMLRDRVTPRQFGAVGDGVADDSDALEKAANSGARLIQYEGLQYRITRQIRWKTSNVVHDMRGARIAQATVNTDAFMIGYDGSAFVKTNDILILGGEIVGADNGLTSTISTGIAVYPPSVVPYVAGAGCENISVVGAKISGFCISIAATGATNLHVDHLYSTNTKYHAAVSAGGYGVLAQTCFGVSVGDNCTFKGSATCRHAIYISADPGRAKDANNVCRNVHIGACHVDWDGVSGATGFEAGVYIRGAFNVTATGTRINGAFGGLLYDLENGPGENITFTGVQATNIRGSAAGEVAGIGLTRSSGSFRAKNVTANGCTVQLAHSNTHGIQFQYADGVTSSANIVGRVGDNYLSGITVIGCTDMVLAPSRIAGNWGYGAVTFSVVSDNVQIDKHVISGSGTRFKYFTVPTSLRYTYPRTFTVTANGAGSVSASNYDGEVLATGAASDANGFSVTLAPEILVAAENFSALSLASQVANVYHRSAAGNTVTFGVLGISAGALSPLPAGSNGYAVQITINR